MRGTFLCLGAALLGAASTNALVFRGSNENKLLMITDMRPDIAAKLLTDVENRWTLEAQSLLSGKSPKPEREVASDVVKSCTKIANSIVQGSDGDADKVSEYFESVCGYVTTKGDKDLCLKFQDGVSGFMSKDSEFDRNELDMSRFCEKFYSGTIREVAQERAKIEEKEHATEKKEQEEAKKAAAEKAVKEAKETEKAAKTAEKAAEEATKANEKGEAAAEKLMEAQKTEAEGLEKKAKKELARAAAVEAAEKAAKKAKKAFEEKPVEPKKAKAGKAPKRK